MKKILAPFLALFLLLGSANAAQMYGLCTNVTVAGVTTCQPVSSTYPIPISGTISSGVTLGTSAAATNPSRSGDATTGLYSAATSTVSVADAGSNIATFSTTGLSLATGLTYQINGTQIAASNLSNGTTGSGAIVLANTPTLITPVLGVATATTINGNTFTTGTGTFTISGTKTVTFSNTLTFAGTDGTTMTFPTTSATVARTDAANTFTGTQTIGALVATTFNGNTFTTGTGVLTLGASKTATISNTLTFTGTDSSSVAFGAGGTVAYLGTTQAWTKGQAVTPSTPAISTATFTPDFTASTNFNVVLVHASCPCTIANPTSPVAGQSGVITVTQSATGSDTIGTWGSQYQYVGGTSTITLSTGANVTDLFPYYVVDSTHITLGTSIKGAAH